MDRQLDFHNRAWEVPLSVYRKRLVSEIATLKKDGRKAAKYPNSVAFCHAAAERLAELQEEIQRVDHHLKTCPCRR